MNDTTRLFGYPNTIFWNSHPTQPNRNLTFYYPIYSITDFLLPATPLATRATTRTLNSSPRSKLSELERRRIRSMAHAYIVMVPGKSTQEMGIWVQVAFNPFLNGTFPKPETKNFRVIRIHH